MTEHNPESNINESTINENPGDKLASDQAAADAHVPTQDVEASADDGRLTPEKIGEAARKMATETAYAAAGFAGLVGEKARAFLDEQKKQYTDAHPDEDGPSAKAFLDQLSEQLNRFADDVTRGYKDMAERGRNVVQGTTQTRESHGAAAPAAGSGPAGTVNDGESPLPGDSPTFSSNLADDVSEKNPDRDDVLPEPGKQDGIL